MEACFRNNSERKDNHYLKIKIKKDKNKFGVGSVVEYSKRSSKTKLIPSRGFQLNGLCNGICG
jgi:hypothetical protein